jgi:hypothetical protein
MSHTFTLAAIAASSFLALTGASFAAPTPSALSATTPAPTSSKTTHMATATVIQAVPFKGTAQSFKPGTDGKSIIVQNKAGEWFTLNFDKACKAIDGAKSVKLSQSTKSTSGWIYVGKLHCKVARFAKASAPEGSAMAPAAPTTTPAPVH